MYAFKAKLRQKQKNLQHLSTRIFNGKSLVLSQSTPFEVIAQYKYASIRYYASANKRYQEPVVFVAPLAVNMAIYDLFPYRSLIQHLKNSGFDVYLIDWGKLDYHHQHLDFLSFIDDAIPNSIELILQHAKVKQISLHGWSMAGVFVTLYTALHQPQAVKNLMVMGSPIDSYASGRLGQLFKYSHSLVAKNKTIQNWLYQGKIPKVLLHSPGILNALGFKIIDPKGWLLSQKQLLNNLHDVNHLHEHATLGNFLNHMVDYPGGINQDMVFNVWLQNPLKNGKIYLHGTDIDLKNIQCPLLVGAGNNDQIVTEAAAKPLIALTNSQDVTFTLIPGGHLGLMSSQRSAAEFWPALSEWLQQRSTAITTG